MPPTVTHHRWTLPPPPHATRTVQDDQHFLPLGVAHFGGLTEKDLVLVTDKYSIEDELRDLSVREVPQGLFPAGVSDQLQPLQVNRGLVRAAFRKHLPSWLSVRGTERGRGIVGHEAEGNL